MIMSFFMDSGYILFVLPAMLFAFIAQSRVNSAYNRYSKVFSRSRMTGEDVARTLLHNAGMESISVTSVQGHLTDHYDPKAKVVRLSSGVYSNSSLAALGIAAHEVGHAIQHDIGYAPLGIRNAIFPLASIGSKAALPLFLIGLLFGGGALGGLLMDIGIAIFFFAVIFQTITLPVEFNASSRALALLEEGGYLQGEELKGAGAVLNAAALTYVAGLAVALGQFLRLLMLRGRRR